MANKLPMDDDEIISEINVTPFIDIMLVLLIIFMLTSSMSFQSGLDIEVPSASQGGPIEKSKKKAVLVSLDQSGRLFVEGKRVEPLNLGQSIKSAMKNKQTQTVIFEGDKDISLEKTLEIIDVAKKFGAKDFAIATQKK